MSKKLFQYAIIASTLVAGPAHALGFGFDLGPFSLQLGGWPSGGPVITQADIGADPICRAIMQHKLLHITVQGKEKVSDTEVKIVTKQITIEPYLFGTNNRHQPVIKGKVVEEKMIKEVTIKFGDENAANLSEGTLTGVFEPEKATGDGTSLNLDRIQQILVIEDSHFDAPAGYNPDAYSDIVNVICEIAVR